MISTQILPSSSKTPPSSKPISGCGISSFFKRIQLILSPKRPTAVPSSPPPPRALRASSFGLVLRYFDEDGDGKISASELCNRLRSVGEELSLADAEVFLDSSDCNGDGKLGYEDFLSLVEVEDGEEKERTLKEAFAAFLMDGKGCITERSLRLALRRLGEEKRAEECRDMIKRFDLNGDGVICFQEFKLMMV